MGFPRKIGFSGGIDVHPLLFFLKKNSWGNLVSHFFGALRAPVRYFFRALRAQFTDFPGPSGLFVPLLGSSGEPGALIGTLIG